MLMLRQWVRAARHPRPPPAVTCGPSCKLGASFRGAARQEGEAAAAVGM